MLEVASFRVCLSVTCVTETHSRATSTLLISVQGRGWGMDSPWTHCRLTCFSWWAGWTRRTGLPAPYAFLPPFCAGCGVLTRSLLMAAGQVHEQCGEA